MDKELSDLDRKILKILTKNARTPFVEVAKQCDVSGAAVHQRVRNMFASGLLSGSQYNVSPKKLGYHTCAYIGIQVNLISTRTHDEVFEKIMKIPGVVECHHISGKYSLMIKVYARDNEGLKNIIVSEIQIIPEITATETFISLEEGFSRQLPIE
ncbi:MAG: Lrp/AsnC ligand binding domain-containing protein [Bacteroidota bacterium]|nr:Lrp/AsnC ligand binding domain-containing protein [Bacteroidota bacterium]